MFLKIEFEGGMGAASFSLVGTLLLLASKVVQHFQLQQFYSAAAKVNDA